MKKNLILSFVLCLGLTQVASALDIKGTISGPGAKGMTKITIDKVSHATRNIIGCRGTDLTAPHFLEDHRALEIPFPSDEDEHSFTESIIEKWDNNGNIHMNLCKLAYSRTVLLLDAALNNEIDEVVEDYMILSIMPDPSDDIFDTKISDLDHIRCSSSKYYPGRVEFASCKRIMKDGNVASLDARFYQDVDSVNIDIRID